MKGKAIPVAVAPKPSNLSKDAIEHIAERVARNIGYDRQGNLPELLSKLGGKVSVKDFWKLDDTNDESIVVQPNDEFEIFIPAHTSPERDRFTIAHELGHYMLHYVLDKDARGKGIFSASRYGKKRVEWEANWFAASLLMPKKAFLRQFKAMGGNINALAGYFKVSTAAAYVRAQALGLIKNDGAKT